MRVGVIGVGNMGSNHARIYSEIANLVCVSDVNEELGKKVSEKFRCSFYKDYKEMIAKEKLDAVSIVVPTSFHKNVALDVIDKGIPFLLEKPIAENNENAVEIIRKAREKNVKFMVGHIERFNPAVIKLKEVLDNFELGEINSIMCRRVGVIPPKVKDTNVIIDLAVHDIDIFNYLLGKKPSKLLGFLGNSLIENGDYADLLLRYGNTNAFIQVNWVTPIKIRLLNVTGSRGYAELNYITQELDVYKSNYAKDFDDFGDFVIKFGKPTKVNIEIKKEEPLKVELAAFLDCVKNGKEFPVKGEDALDALKIALELSNNKN
ncbi:MAG: Gfo/Idh/MocA family oxidoreductase [Nanoarchaeota archaeon]